MIETTISTNENLVQDNSSIEYVTPETNPMDTVQSNELIFGQKHNDIDCALCPTAKRACDRAWVTAKQIENWSKMSMMTLNRRLRDLEECERIQSLSDLIKIKIEDNNGRGHETTLYNLNVLNQLAMVEMKNKVLNDTAKKFSDILSEVETTGSYSIKTQSVMLPNFCDPAEAARAWADLYEKNQAAEKRAITAESERDEAIRTKAQIGDKKVATAMGTASAKSKECERLKKELGKMESEIASQMPTIREAIRKEYEDVWTTARDWCFKHKLSVYTNEPKWTVSNLLADICMAYPEREQWHMNAYGVRLFPKWACDILDKMYDEDSTLLAEYRTA